MLAQHPNITAIGSNVGESEIMQAIARVGADRVCFGSDMPFRWQHVILAMYRAMMRDLSDNEQAKVMGGNLARLLSLSA